MNVLFIHSKSLEYEAKKKTQLAEELSEELKKKKIGECLACFMSFEEADAGNEEAVSAELVGELKENCGRLGVKTVVLYPYVHLLFGKKPSSAATALKVLESAEKLLGEAGLNAVRSPFGWYKAFKLECIGHPLSELSRVISGGKAGEEVSSAVKAEEKLKSAWYVLESNGKMHEIKTAGGRVEGFNFKGHENLERFALYELAKARASTIEPPHVKLMKRLELADYEPGSDPGNMRYPPKGKLVKSLLEEFVSREMVENGALEIESPIMYDYNHPSLKKYLDKFPARQYTIDTPNKKVFLRFAACFGQFLMMHDATISYKHMPLWVYELTRYSFRVEKRGELAGLRRLRAFTMPDCHAFCAGMEQAKQEFIKRYNLAREIQKAIGLRVPGDLELAVRSVKPFWKENEKFVKGWVKGWGKPVLVEMWEQQHFYFVLKYEFNFVDALGKASALTTDQIDTENAERYGITFVDKENNKVHPLILHLSPTGAIERVIYALLERAFMWEKQGKIPSLPLWLAPTQVRVLSLSEKFVKLALETAGKLEGLNVRADVDDRDESVSKKVRDAELEWVPFIVVVGEKEAKSKRLTVRTRGVKKQEQLSLEKLAERVKKETKGMPFKPLALPKRMSKRPLFSG